MGGSSPDVAVEGSSAASSKKSQPAKKEAAQKGKPATSKGKGRSKEGPPKGGASQTPNSRGQEAPPGPPPPW
jgi:hypothetical protein